MIDAIKFVDPSESEEDGTPAGEFFQTSIQKLLLYSFATASLYFLYWHYKQWQVLKAATGANISPGWRAVFSPLFVFELFKWIREHSGVAGPSTLLAALYCLPVLAANIRSVNDLFWMVSLIAVFPLSVIQREVNDYMQREHPGSDKNESIGPGGAAVIAAGAVLWLIFIAQMVLLETN